MIGADISSSKASVSASRRIDWACAGTAIISAKKAAMLAAMRVKPVDLPVDFIAVSLTLMAGHLGGGA